MDSPYHGMAIFDADGTVIGTTELHDEIGRQCRAKFGIVDFDIHSQDTRAYFVKAGLPDAAYREYLEIFSATEREFGVRVFPFVNDVLSELRRRGYITGIFSNRKLRPHNHEMFFGSGLNYNLLDFFLMPRASNLESEIYPESLHPIYIATDFSKPCGFAVMALYNLIQEIPGAPRSITYSGDAQIDFEFADQAGLSFKGVLSGVTKSRDTWIKLGVPATDIIPDIRNLLDILL